jgi:hypothetical protein
MTGRHIFERRPISQPVVVAVKTVQNQQLWLFLRPNQNNELFPRGFPRKRFKA